MRLAVFVAIVIPSYVLGMVGVLWVVSRAMGPPYNEGWGMLGGMMLAVLFGGLSLFETASTTVVAAIVLQAVLAAMTTAIGFTSTQGPSGGASWLTVLGVVAYGAALLAALVLALPKRRRWNAVAGLLCGAALLPIPMEFLSPGAFVFLLPYGVPPLLLAWAAQRLARAQRAKEESAEVSLR